MLLSTTLTILAAAVLLSAVASSTVDGKFLFQPIVGLIDIGYWHHDVVSTSVCPSITLLTVMLINGRVGG